MAPKIRTHSEIITGNQGIVLDIAIPSDPPVTAASKVFATVTEVTRDGFVPFVGAARMFVCNLSPSEGFVRTWVQVDWDNPLLIRVDYLIID